MPRWIGFAGLLMAASLAVIWMAGGFAAMESAALAAQKDIQTSLAGAIRRLRGGQPGAMAAFLAVCFAYGFLHAAGPGHGKLIIGSYGVARRVPVARLMGIALLSSLAQAGVAVAIVGTGFWVLGYGRDLTEAAATRLIAPLGTLAIAGIGVWLIWRGARGMIRQRFAGKSQTMDDSHGKAHGHDHGHDHEHDHGDGHHHGHDHGHHHHGHAHAAGHDETCTHAHGPSLDEVASLTSARDALVLIAGIALRPCSGALLVLILCFQLGLALVGVIGVFAMGLGTAMVTIAVAALAIWGREGALTALSGQRLALALPLFELSAGAVIALTALSLLKSSL